MCILKTSASNADPPWRFTCSCSALLSGGLLSGGEALRAVAAVMLSSWCCAVAALLSVDGPRLLSHLDGDLISSRTGFRTASSAVHFTDPQSEKCAEVLSGTGSTSYKDKLAVLVLLHATCLSAQ